MLSGISAFDTFISKKSQGEKVMKYVLASASPRRQELLTQAGFSFDVIPSAVKEKITKDIPSDVVMELAHQKLLMYTNHG